MTQCTVEQAFEIALQFHRAGELPQAEAIYRQILGQDSNHTDALHMLGLPPILSGIFGRLHGLGKISMRCGRGIDADKAFVETYAQAAV